jgi:hypothetical protein
MNFVDFFRPDIPEYAILSHRWREDEAMLADVQRSTATNSQGLKKVHSFVNYVKEHISDIEWVWIDACCIDQKNNVELTESINSMYRWYHDARVCIAYMHDVDEDDSSFDHSEWFLRGWTLQELLAPQIVVFVSCDWRVIGHKGPNLVYSADHLGFFAGPLLNSRIAGITDISEIALRDYENARTTLGASDIYDWMKDRRTTREEDESYCLLGLLGINMNIRYGEGRFPTKERLLRKLTKKQGRLDFALGSATSGFVNEAIMKIDDGPPEWCDQNRTESGSSSNAVIGNVPVALQAAFDASSKQDDPLCLENTRTEVLKRIRAWIFGEEVGCIFWLNGMAGTGKSTVSRTIARDSKQRGVLGASFFFVRGSGPLASHAALFWTTIANQLAIAVPEVKQHIVVAVKQQPDIASKSRFDQWTQLIVEPFKKLSFSKKKLVVIVIDALDECDDDGDMKGIISILARAGDMPNIQFRVVVTSRPETPIRLGFKKLPVILHRSLLLHDVPREIVDGDICLFLYDQFVDIRDEHGLPEEWPSVDEVNELVLVAGGFFIFAATACRFMRQYDMSAQDSLKLFLRTSDHNTNMAGVNVREAHSVSIEALDELYHQIMTRARKNTPLNRMTGENAHDLKFICGAMANLPEPVNAEVLSSILGIKPSELSRRLEKLRSIIRLPEASVLPIRFFHISFGDFLLDESRSRPRGLHTIPEALHSRLLLGCLAIMERGLRRNICDLDHPGVRRDDIPDDLVEIRISSSLRYACRYWTFHWTRSKSNHDNVNAFIKVHMLHWLETMSLLKLWSEAGSMIASTINSDMVSYA